MGRERSLQILTVVAVLVGAALTLPFRHLWDPDESRYAEVTREMLASHQMLLPLLDGEPYPHKPPLFFWAQAALRAGGVPWTAAAVLPSLAAFLALLALLPRLAVDLGLDRATGRLAGALLASSPFAVGLALGGRMDMLLALTHTLSLCFLAQLLGVGSPPSARWQTHMAFWTSVAAGVLVKGPVALALPLLAALAMWAVSRRRLSLRPLWVGWGPVVALAIVAAWLVPAALAAGGAYLQDVVIRQTAERVTANAFAHPQPFYYHLVTYPITGLPWSPVVILGCVCALRRPGRDAATFLSLAVVTLLLLFSAVAGKLAIYLLPMFPVASLLAADALRRAVPGLRLALAAGGSVMAAAGIALAISPHLRAEMASAPWLVGISGAAVALPALLATLTTARGAAAAPAHAMAVLCVSGAVFSGLALPIVAEAIDPFMSTWALGRAVAEREPGRDEGLVYGDRYPGLSLYGARRFAMLASPQELDSALAAGRCVVISEKHLRLVSSTLSMPVVELARAPHRRRILLLVRGGGAPQSPGTGKVEISPSSPSSVSASNR